MLQTPQTTPSTVIPSIYMHSWEITRSAGTATEILNRQPPNDPIPEIWIHRLSKPALVLGSTQSTELLNQQLTNDNKIEISKRRSGGGIVRVQPLDLWVDAILPRESQLWEHDVGHSMEWIGQVWAKSLATVFFRSNPQVHKGKLQNRNLGQTLCFAGLGPGEVSLDNHKVVGISQRRTRTYARFQCLAKYRWTPDLVRPYLTPIRGRAEQPMPWNDLKIGLPASIPNSTSTMDDIEFHFVKHLPPS